MKRFTTIIKIAIGVLIGLIVAKFIPSNKTKTVFSFIDTNTNVVGQAFQIFSKNYVEDVDLSSISDSTIEYFMSLLDPHSKFVSREDVAAEQERLVGSFSGIGIEFTLNRDTIYVIHAISGGPSQKLGIQAGDKVIKINDSIMAGVKLNNMDVVKLLRGEKGTKVNVSIKRKGVQGLLKFTITRDNIPLYSIDGVFKVSDDAGYIHINRFSGTTYPEFLDAVQKLKKEGTKNFVIDLRGNGGGYLKSVVDICNEILPEGDMIVFTEGKEYPKEAYYSDGNGILLGNKIAILVDEGSASGSEILSGAIQDNDLGHIIGRRTFGKGLVQKPFSLKDGSMLVLTISKYYTPAGRNIQKPYALSNEAEYYQEISERYERGEVFYADSIQIPDSLKFFTKSGRVVYGGGGIVPDIFIPIDTTQNSSYFIELLYSGALNRFALDYADLNRATFEEKENFKEFINSFSISEEIVSDFLKYTRKNFPTISHKPKEFKTSKKLIKERLKALISQNIFDSHAFYYALSQDDKALEEALQIFERETSSSTPDL